MHVAAGQLLPFIKHTGFQPSTARSALLGATSKNFGVEGDLWVACPAAPPHRTERQAPTRSGCARAPDRAGEPNSIPPSGRLCLAEELVLSPSSSGSRAYRCAALCRAQASGLVGCAQPATGPAGVVLLFNRHPQVELESISAVREGLWKSYSWLQIRLRAKNA